MDIDLDELVRATGGVPMDPLDASGPLNRVSTDTRTLERNDVFFALGGARYNGHDYLEEAVSKGARCLVVSDVKRVPAGLRRKAACIVVKDTLRAYGDAAAFWRRKFRIPVVAVTGSSGKTTVKDWIAHCLSARYAVLKNRGTENNLVGVPKTLLQIDASSEALVLELGTNRPGEIERLSEIAMPQIGVITQIGHSHLEGLGSIEGVRDEKLSLMRHLERGGHLVLNGEDPLLKDVRSGVHRVIRAGFSRDGADFSAEQIWCHEKGGSFRLNGETAFETSLIGRHNILNALLAVVTGLSLHVETEALQKAVASFRPPSGRLNMKLLDGIHFIDDTYNANPTSFKAALETLKSFKVREKKGVVCGDMLELGPRAAQLHAEMGEALAEYLFDFVIAAGPQSRHLVEGAVRGGYALSRIHHVTDSAEAGRLCRRLASAGDWVLVKGSRAMQMEKVLLAFA